MAPTTKDRIAQALVHLLSYTTLEKITVKKLIETANVNKSTYYYHFSQISDVTKYIEKQFINEFQNQFSHGLNSSEIFGNDTILVDNSSAMFEYIYEHKDIFSALINSSIRDEFRDEFVHCIRSMTDKYNWKICKPGHDESYLSAAQKKYYTYHNAYSQYAFLECWAKNNYEESPRELADLICYLHSLTPSDIVLVHH